MINASVGSLHVQTRRYQESLLEDVQMQISIWSKTRALVKRRIPVSISNATR